LAAKKLRPRKVKRVVDKEMATNFNVLFFSILFFIGKSMSKNLRQVNVKPQDKTTGKTSAFLLLSLFLSACTSLHPYMKLTPHDDWLAQPVEFSKINNLRLELEQISSLNLKTRGEAHITVITPPEFSKLKSKLSMEEINTIALKSNIEKPDWKPLCVAQASLKEKATDKLISQTFYVVVESEQLTSIRQNIQKEFEKKGGIAQDFDAIHFYPHITIGFTERDLHEHDGVIKDTRHCVYELQTEAGKGRLKWNAN
jgi:2'-5' RNA ligase